MSTSFDKKIGAYQVSHEYTQLQAIKAKVTEKDKVINGQTVKIKTFKEVNKAKTDTFTVRLTTSDLGQQLTFCFQRGGNDEDVKDPLSRILATFTMTKDFQLSMVCDHEFNKIDSYIYKPLLTAFPGIEAGSVSEVFSEWLCTPEFFSHLQIVSSKKGYTPALVKMLILYISYQDVKDEMGTQSGQLPQNMVVDVQEVAKVFRANMQALQNKLPRMAQHYKPDLMLSGSTEPTQPITNETVEKVEVITPDQVETPDKIPAEEGLQVEPIEVLAEEETLTNELPKDVIEQSEEVTE